jgi:hypothetical protein
MDDDSNRMGPSQCEEPNLSIPKYEDYTLPMLRQVARAEWDDVRKRATMLVLPPTIRG